MILDGMQWKVAQYNLSVPIPNALVEGVAQEIVAFEQGASALSAGDPASDNTAKTREDAAESTEPKTDNCLRKRHKTNSKAGC